MAADGLPPAIKTFRNRPFFRGAMAATEAEAKRIERDEKRKGRTIVIHPWHGTFAVYHAR